jgi:hypothetical protein
MVTYGISNITQNSKLNLGTQNVVDNFMYNRAHDIAGSMTDILMMRIANDLGYRVNSQATEDLFGGEVTYVVEDTFFDGDSLIKITVAADYNGVEKLVISYVNQPTDGWVPPVVRGAWTANANLNKTISDMFIDGRDHDINLNLIPNSGVPGISTSTDFENLENAAIGGTYNFVDYPMTFPEVPEVIEENYNWGGTFPESPDEILGWPEGTLKAAAQSGQNGSQYLLLPSNEKTIDSDILTYPLSGVTYIDVQNSADIDLLLEENGNSGIIVVHRDNGDSKIGSVKSKNSDGLFTGLMIFDYSFHHHIDILGAVLMLSPDLETSKNCNGNADHWVKYSSQVIENSTKTAAEITGLMGTVGYGFAKKRVNVRYVYE